MYRSRRAVVAVVVAVSLFASPAASAASLDVESSVVGVDVTGEGAATVVDGDQYVWAGEPTDFNATIGDYVTESESYYETYVVRLTRERDATYDSNEESLAVGRVTLGELEARNVTLTVPAGELEPGFHRLHVTTYEPAPGEDRRINETDVVVHAVRKTGDVDGDDLTNLEEVDGPTSFLDFDTDDDDLGDGNEVQVFGSDPTLLDTDGDGIDDPQEVRAGTDPAAPDTDSDDIEDVPELDGESSATADDTDLDGLVDPVELELGTDPRARDTDGDGLSDATEYRETDTDPTRADTDGDGIDDAAEVQRFQSNPLSRDTDGDGVPDAREVLRGTDPTVVNREQTQNQQDRSDEQTDAEDRSNQRDARERADGLRGVGSVVGWLLQAFAAALGVAT